MKINEILTELSFRSISRKVGNFAKDAGKSLRSFAQVDAIEKALAVNKKKQNQQEIIKKAKNYAPKLYKKGWLQYAAKGNKFYDINEFKTWAKKYFGNNPRINRRVDTLTSTDREYLVDFIEKALLLYLPERERNKEKDDSTWDPTKNILFYKGHKYKLESTGEWFYIDPATGKPAIDPTTSAPKALTPKSKSILDNAKNVTISRDRGAPPLD